MPITTLDPKSALVSIDLQAWLSGLPTVDPIAEVVKNVSSLAKAFRQQGKPVIHVRLGYALDFGDAFHSRADSPLSGPEPSPGWDSGIPGLDAQPSDLIVTKHQWNGFHGTDLDDQLRRRGVTGIVLAGVATSIGVESTARAALDHGYQVTIASDAVTDLNPTSHANSIEQIFPLFAEVDSTDAIVRTLQS